MFRKQNMSGITAIHYPLRQVDSSSGKVCLLVYVGDFIDWSAMDPHPELEFRVILQRLCNLERALDRRLRTIAKNQCHPVACRQSDQFACCFRGMELLASRDNFVQLTNYFALLVNQ